MGLFRVNNLNLYADSQGSGPPVLLLHGFTGSADSWKTVRQQLNRQWTTIAIDIIGHGRSDAPPDPYRYRIERAVEDIDELLDQLGHSSVHLIGYSMGGRIALHFAIRYPERVRCLLLESASPGIANATVRAERRASDEKLAQVIEHNGVEAFIDFWESIPLFSSQRSLPEAIQSRVRKERLQHSVPGLAGSLRGMGAGAMQPLHQHLSELAMPVHFIAGELDSKYSQIGRTLAQINPKISLTIVPEAGHTIHLEEPGVFIAQVETFLLKQERGTS